MYVSADFSQTTATGGHRRDHHYSGSRVVATDRGRHGGGRFDSCSERIRHGIPRLRFRRQSCYERAGRDASRRTPGQRHGQHVRRCQRAGRYDDNGGRWHLHGHRCARDQYRALHRVRVLGGAAGRGLLSSHHGADSDTGVQFVQGGATAVVLGIAYERGTDNLFAAALLRRSSGLGAAGLGGIYVTDTASNTTSRLVDLQSAGIDVGEIAFTAMAISADQKTLYVTNLAGAALLLVNRRRGTRLRWLNG